MKLYFIVLILLYFLFVVFSFRQEFIKLKKLFKKKPTPVPPPEDRPRLL